MNFEAHYALSHSNHYLHVPLLRDLSWHNVSKHYFDANLTHLALFQSLLQLL